MEKLLMFAERFSYIFVLLIAILWVMVAVKFIKNKYAPVRKTAAVVTDKYKKKSLSGTYGGFKRECCVVVFSAGKKKLAFNVSEFSFGNYKVNEKGTLRYKGNKLIDFN